MAEEPGTHRPPNPPQEQSGNRRLLKFGGIGCAAVLGLCVVLAVVVVIAVGDDDDDTVSVEPTQTEEVATTDDFEEEDTMADDNGQVAATDDDEPSEEVESTPEATDEPEPEPEGDEVPEEFAGEIDVQVSQYDLYETSTGSIQLFGILENHGDGHADIREILVTLRADDGSVAASATSHTYVDVIAGNARSPFTVRITDPPADYAEIEIEVESREPRDAWFTFLERHREWDIVQADYRGERRRPAIIGEIENAGEEASSLTSVYTVGYDSEGVLLFVERGYASRDLIRSGSRSPFSISVDRDDIPEPAEIEVFVEGWIEDDEDEDETETEGEVPDEFAGQIDVQVGQYDLFQTISDSIEIFGILENHGEGHAEIRQILVTLRAEDGSVADVSSSSTYVDVISGNGRSPFTVRFSDPPAKYGEIEIEYETREPQEAWFTFIERHRDWNVLQADFRTEERRPSVVGEIENAGDEAASLVSVYSVGYDAEGTLLFVERGYADRDLIRPGETSPYSNSVSRDEVPEPAEIETFVEGWVDDDD